MCKLESIKWAVIKSNQNISKTLTAKLSKVRFGSTQENTFSFYYFNDEDFNNIVETLKTYKKQKFEVVRFYDKQFGLTLNSWNGFSVEYSEKVSKLPLSNIFSWFDNKSNRVSITPITQKQFNNIIKIN